MRLAAGHRLGTYEVVRALAAGGMGEVYEARDVRLGRIVALKVVRSDALDPTSVQRLEQEARAASALNHPNIVTIYGVGEEGPDTFIAMELVQGTTLRAAMSGGALPIERVLDIAAQLADAMAAAHSAGIVHRDLKPENVILTNDGVVKVLDFGLARRRPIDDHGGATALNDAPMSLTRPGVIVGTVAYMSPEQAAGRPLGPPSDQFSFGIILYEMLSGVRPFRGATEIETLAAIIHQPAEPIRRFNECVPDPLGRLLDRLFAKSPQDRFADTRALAVELRRMRAKSSEAYVDRSSGNESTMHVAVPVSRRRAIWIGGAAATGAMVAGALWIRSGPSSGERALAVLPFENGGADPESEYLSDGITEGLIEQLSRVPAIKVKARSTVFAFKSKGTDPQAIGRQLGVDAILTGTIAQRGDRLKVAAELVDVRGGTRMWGQTYDVASAELLPLQIEIAKAVVNEGFKLSTSRTAATDLSRKPTDDPDAYELYLRARYQFMLESEEGYLAARDLATQAVRRDPKFALAYVLIGSTYTVMAIDGFARPTESWPMADRNLKQAVALDPGVPDARFLAADEEFFFNWNFDGAEQIWQGIVADARTVVDPDWYRARALRFWALGHPDKALEVIRFARRLDPVAIGLRITEADYLVHDKQLPLAIEKYREVIRDEGRDARAYFGLSEAYARQQRFDEALDARRDAERIAGDSALEEVLAAAKGEAGFKRVERDAARLQIGNLTVRAKSGAYVSPLDFARAFAMLGEAEQAFKYFEPAFADRAPALVFLNVDRAWDSVRRDSRFKDAVGRVRLPVVSSPS